MQIASFIVVSCFSQYSLLTLQKLLILFYFNIYFRRFYFIVLLFRSIFPPSSASTLMFLGHMPCCNLSFICFLFCHTSLYELVLFISILLLFLFILSHRPSSPPSLPSVQLSSLLVKFSCWSSHIFSRRLPSSIKTTFSLLDLDISLLS